jgi:hypothetical protein
MAGVALAQWRRTGPLRHGRVAGAEWPTEPITLRTSRLTLVPALGGLAVTAAGLTVAIGNAVGPGEAHAVPAVALAASGSIIAWAGWSGRVIALRVRPGGLSVVYRRRRAFDVPWNTLQRVAAPRWPLGGWRLTIRSGATDGDHRTLMPSDVIGNEWVLEAAVSVAQLGYDGRGWTAATGR